MEQFLSLVNYDVKELRFRLLENKSGTVNFKIKPQIGFNFRNNEERLLATAFVKVDNSEESPTPFELYVEIAGNFAIERAGGDIFYLQKEAAQYLYPYLRQLASALPVQAQLPAYFLPPLDYNKFGPPPATPPTKKDNISIRPLDDDEL